MLILGYAINYRYADNGTTEIQVRIPTAHGPMDKAEYMGKTARNYVAEKDLPYYMSVILPHMPNYGDVVVLSATTEAKKDWIVVGLTGGNYQKGARV